MNTMASNHERGEKKKVLFHVWNNVIRNNLRSRTDDDSFSERNLFTDTVISDK